MLWIQQLRSANWSLAGWISLFSYLLGCFTTGYYLVRARLGRDIRALGSGSVGARNVGRVLGRLGFSVTLAGDFGKGAFVMWAAPHFTTDGRLLGLAMLAVVVGHIWPAQLRFHGGKGVATSLGALLLYDYHLAVAFAILFAAGQSLPGTGAGQRPNRNRRSFIARRGRADRASQEFDGGNFALPGAA